MPAIPKPTPRPKRKKTAEYEAFRQSVFSIWWSQRSAVCIPYEHMGESYVPIHCAICNEPGLLVRKEGIYRMTLDVGHIEGRGRRPELKMEITNVRPECRKCNSRLSRGA